MPRLIRLLIVFTALTLAASVACAQDAQQSLLSSQETTSLDAAMRAEMENQQVVGLALGVIRNGRVAYLQGYGYENREEQIPVTTETMFRWASISKTLTAVAAMQLVEQGQLDLQADVRGYVPEFPDPGAVITPRLLLCHQSGIVHYFNGRVIRSEREYDAPHPFADVILALDTFKTSPLVCTPGEKFSYTTHGYILLSGVVQRAGRQPFADQVKQRIANPLGMTTLRPDYQWEDIPHRAVGYRRRRGEIVVSTNTDVSWKLAGGGFISSIEDLARYAAGLTNGVLVSPRTEIQMWTPQPLADSSPTRYGLGFTIELGDRALKVSHSGSQEKTKTRLVILPRQKRGVVVMSNSEYADPKAFTTAAFRVLAP